MSSTANTSSPALAMSSCCSTVTSGWPATLPNVAGLSREAMMAGKRSRQAISGGISSFTRAWMPLQELRGIPGDWASAY